MRYVFCEENRRKIFAKIILSSGDASDSICPKGWGIAGYDGDGSWHKLIALIYRINKANISLGIKHKEYNSIIIFDSSTLTTLFSLVHSGMLTYANQPESRSSQGDYWINSSYPVPNEANARRLNTSYMFIYAISSGSKKGSGLSVRCVAK